MSPPRDVSSVPGGRLGRAVVRWFDAGRARELAERRVGAAVHAAVPMRLHERALGSNPQLLLALTDDTVYVLELRDRRPVAGLKVGGVTAAIPRDELVAHFERRRLSGRVRAELSWPQRQAFIAGDLPNDELAEELIGLIAADEIDRLGT